MTLKAERVQVFDLKPDLDGQADNNEEDTTTTITWLCQIQHCHSPSQLQLLGTS
jgi:hypothetical protein